jgi:hypothetical protein
MKVPKHSVRRLFVTPAWLQKKRFHAATLTGWSASNSEPYIKTRWALSRSEILRGNHGISPKSEQKETCFGCDKERFIEIKTTRRYNALRVDQAQSIELELRRATIYTPRVPKIIINAFQYIQVCCLAFGYETTDKRKILLALPDFDRQCPFNCFQYAITHSQNYKLQTLYKRLYFSNYK